MISLLEVLGLLESVIHLSNITTSIWKQFPSDASVFHYQFRLILLSVTYILIM